MSKPEIFVSLGAVCAATVLGYALGGLALAGYGAFSAALSCAVGLLWIETHRLRRAQATRTNRIGKRISSLERQSSELERKFAARQDQSEKQLERLQSELAKGVKQLADASKAGSDRQQKELRELRKALETKLDTELAARTEEITASVAGTAEQTGREFEANLKEVSRDANRILYSQVDGLLALYRDIDPDQALPPMHGWAVAPDFARYLFTEVTGGKYERVVECGSGSTTVILAYAMRTMGTGHVVAIENNPHFAAVTRHMLAERGLSAWAEVIDAPLAEVDIDGNPWRWYDTSKLPEGPIDLLLVDGPPGQTGPLARYPALPLLADRLAPDAVVMLDDASRKDEQKIKRRWLEEFPEYGHKLLRNDHGTFVLRRDPNETAA
ncbi:class I SAM-dependent methyltransferase [Glycomyces buryatensis]|nr:class I SAM-dependent methyltransferase [Glycomyces buryatensis]